MGGTIEIPFAVGSEVWWVGRGSREEVKPCPECLGSKVIKLVQGNGAEFNIDCAGCSRGYEGPFGVVKEVITEYKPERITLGTVSVSGKEVRYSLGDGGRYVDSTDCFTDEAACLAECQKNNVRDTAYRAEQAVNNLKSKRRDMAWSVHYWQGMARRLRDDLKATEARLDVVKARAAKKEAANV